MAETTNTAEILIVADASGVEAGLRQATNAAERTERQITTGANNSARSQGSLISAIQRTTAQMESGGRAGSRYFEILAQQRGVNPQALEPYLRQLRAVEQAQQRAGQSAAQTSNAMRQLPAQMTDVLTSLQGGSSPLTVLMQQGGQIADSFGGVGAAIRNVGSHLLGLLNPITLTTAAVAGLTYAFYAGSKEAREYNLAIATTGNAAGTSAALMAEAAAQTAEFVGSQSNAAKVLASMVATGQISGAVMVDLSVAAIKAQRDLGREVSVTIEEYNALGRDPVKGLADLIGKYHHLSGATYAQVKALQDEGRTVEAVTLAQKEHAKGITSQTARVVENLGYIESAWKGIKNGVLEAAGATKDWFLSMGRDTTLADLTASAAKIQKNIDDANARKDTWGARKQQALLDVLNGEIAAMQKKLGLSQQEAESEARRARADQLRIEITNGLDTLLSREQLRARDIAAARTKATEAGLSQVETERLLAVVRKKYADVDEAAQKKREAAAKTAAEALKKEAGLLAELAGLTPGFAEDWERLSKAYGKGALSLDQLTKAQADLLAKQPGIKKASDDQIKAQAESDKLYEQGIKTAEQYRDSLLEQITAQQQSNEVIGLSTQAAADLVVRRLQDAAALKEQTAASLDAVEPGSRVAELYRAQAAALRELASAKDEGARKQIAADSARQAAEDWKRAAEDINRSLTDALLRGFESGKSFGKNLVDTLKNMFSTLVLRPVIQGVMAPVTGALLGSAPGAAQASGGGVGGAMGAASSLGGIAGLFGAGGLAGSVMAGAGWLTGATTLGGSLAAAGSLAATGTLGGIASSLGMAVGALGPIALGIGAAVAIWKKLDTSGTYHTGGAASASASGASVIRAESLNFQATRTSSETEKLVTQLASGMVGILDSTALAFGKTAGYTAATAFADDTSKDGAWGSLVISKMGEKLVDWQDTRTSKWAPKEFADGAKGQQQYLEALTKSVRQALDGIGLPAWATKMLDSLGKEAGLDEMAKVVESINATQSALKTMGAHLVGFSSLSDGAVTALINASGGIQNLAGATSAYYENFYSDSEKTAAATKQVADAFKAAGLQMPATKDEFRKLVEAQMALGEKGAGAVTALLGVSAAFAQLSDAVTEERKGLQGQLDQLTLTPEQLRNKERGKLDESNRLLFDQISFMTERKGLQDQLDKLTLSSSELLQRQRDALHSSNRALLDQVTVLAERKNLQDQLDEVTLSAAELQAKQREAIQGSNRALFDQINILSERKDLQEKLDQVTLTSAQLLERQRNALDESNRGLFDQITVMTERKGLQEQLDDLTLTSGQLLKKQRDALDESNRALFDQVQAVKAQKEFVSSFGGAIMDSIGRAEQAAKALRDFNDSLLLGNLSALDPDAKYRAAKSQFEAAGVNDTQAMQAFLQASKDRGADSFYYERDFAAVQAKLAQGIKQADAYPAALAAMYRDMSSWLSPSLPVFTAPTAPVVQVGSMSKSSAQQSSETLDLKVEMAEMRKTNERMASSMDKLTTMFDQVSNGGAGLVLEGP
ncbi:phage tail length tape measure family protein [Massilia sp. X63]|uniref:phage tail length tape measure family protein n=1 Tax=Massilia sp. X63 TaxID=3237285 RepID=UPI0034DD1C40